MNSTEYLDRIGPLIAEENKNPECWWYLAFAGDEGFRGAVICRGRGVVTASLIAESYGASPGGEVLAIEITGKELPHPRFWNRLLSLTELREAFGENEVGHFIHDGDTLTEVR